MARSLGELLREEGLVDDDALQAAARVALRQGQPLVLALVEGGRVGERAVVEVLERRLKLPRFDADADLVDGDAVRELPYATALMRLVLPLARRSGAPPPVPAERAGGRRVMRLAMADPLDHDAVDEVEATTGCRVEPVLASPSELAAAIERAYRGLVTKMIPRGRPATGPVEIVAADDKRGLAATATEPHARIEDLAPVDVRLRALLALLYEKHVLDEEEFAEAVRKLLKADAGD